MFCAGSAVPCGAAYVVAFLARDGFYHPPKWDGKKMRAVQDFAEAVRLAASGCAVALVLPGGGVPPSAALLLASAAEADLSALPPETAGRVAETIAELREATDHGRKTSGARG